MDKYERYSGRTRQALEKADRIIYESSRGLRGTPEFLKNLEDSLLITEAESIINRASNAKAAGRN